VHASYITPKGMCDVSRDLLKFWETSDNISLTPMPLKVTFAV